MPRRSKMYNRPSKRTGRGAKSVMQNPVKRAKEMHDKGLGPATSVTPSPKKGRR